ncbi:uncharacterized protein LOC124265084 [Haliotis rubra]|uniref:uncharacterized protein LOC124265084 n=1 Tax=Haliotis rubra TaxID=36100 RepID=UPI001EE630C8|nr:uncharacterized protein LOC124265084 [Haliotis rubra]
MPGIMLKGIKEMLSPTTKMDADTCDGSSDDSDNNDCPQRDGTEEACPPPVDQDSKVTTSKKMDADTCDGSTDDINNNDCPQRDGTEEACTPPVDQHSKVTTSKKMDAHTCDGSTDDTDNNDCPQRDGTEEACTPPVDQQNVPLQFDVKGAVNSDVKNNYAIGQLHLHKEEVRKDVTMDYVPGAEPKIDISVPAKEGETIVHVECTKNELSSCCYGHYDGRERPFRSKWTFENVPHGLIKFIMKECPTFFELIDKLEKRHRSKCEKIHNKSCLVVEFLHDTEEDRDRMMQDKENVKTMFMEFLHGIGKDAPNCSLNVCSEPAAVNIRDEDVKEIIGANPRDTKFTNTSDSDSDSFVDATDEIVEDTEQAANLPSTSQTEDAKERIGLNPEGTPPIITSASDSESSLVLSPISSDTKRTHAQTEVLVEEPSSFLIGGSKFDSGKYYIVDT